MSTSAATNEPNMPIQTETITNAQQARTLRYQLPRTRTVDDFVFEADKIGEGTYGTVFKARDKHTGEIVAVKKIRISQKDNGLPITAVREIKLLKRLTAAENVVILKDIILETPAKRNVEGECIYLVFEYMEHDLSGLSKTVGHRFVPGQVCCYTKQLLEGLYFCHKRNILHRDIKGANLLINKEGVLKLADFGLARKMKEDSRYTIPVVTLWYRAPELLLGSKIYNAAIDMWSVGCLLVELYTHKPLFPGKTEIEQISRIFDICGTPDVGNWPEGKSLPLFQDMRPKQHRPRILRRYVRDHSRTVTPEALDLIDDLLSLDPAKRPTAESALDYQYFFKEPLIDISCLPKYEHSHNELSSKRAREADEQRQKNEPPHKRFRGNDSRPPYRLDDRRRDDRFRGPSGNGRPTGRYNSPYGSRNPEYVPPPRNNSHRHSSGPRDYDRQRRYPSNERSSRPRESSREPPRDTQKPRGEAPPTHTVPPPRDYREHGLGDNVA